MTSSPPNDLPSDANPSATPPPPPVPDHELLRRVGRGAYGEVWLARSVTGAFRAVKIVHRASFDHDRPFEREFEGILKFEPISRRHDSQVDILHVGRADDCFYYVMELADDQATGGQIPDPALYKPRTLKSDLVFRSRLPFEECVSVAIALTTALEHLHGHGLVHRDVKPSNIIFVNGVAKLADIGLVTGIDATRSYVGTEGFAAPEGPGTAQADLFSLGKVIYEMATGKDRQEFPELPTQLRELPDREGLMELNAVIAEACRHDPKDRYGSAAAMRADLELLQSGKSLARLHRTEAQLRFVRRAGALITALAAVIALGWFWQARQTQVVRELVTEKTKLAEDKSRLLRQQEEALIRANSATGSQRLEAEDPAAALPWLVEALRRLEAHRPAQAEPHRLRLGNILRYHPRLLNVFAQTGAVHTLAFSPDGQWLAAGSNDGQTQLINLQTSSTARWLGHTSAVNSVEFSRDSASLLTACDDGAARLWPVANSNAPVLLRHQGAVRHATFSPDGQLVLTASFDQTAQIWRAHDGAKVGGPLEHGMPVFHATFSPNGNQIATGSGFRSWAGEFNVWTKTGDRWTAIPNLLSAPATSTAFSPDGTRAAASCGEAYFDLLVSRPGALIDARSGALIRKLEHIDRITHVAFSPDGRRLAVAALGYEVLICDSKTGESLIPPLKHVRWVHRAVFSPDGRWVASASSDGTTRVWDAATGVPITPPLKHLGEIFSVAFDPSGRLLATAGDGGLVYIWDIGHVEPDRPSIWFSPGEVSAEFTADDRHLVTYAPKRSNPGTASQFPARGEEPVQVHELQTGRRVLTCPVPGGTPFEGVMISPAGDQLSVGSYNGQIRLWDLHTKELRWESPATGDNAVSRGFSNDGKLLAICSPYERNKHCDVRLWSTIDGQSLMTTMPHPDLVRGATFSPDDRILATACCDGKVRLWEIASGRLIRTILIGNGEVDVVRFSRDGRQLLTADKYDKTARLWAVASGELVFPPMRHTGIVWDALFDPAERRILTHGGDLTAAQWDAQTGERIDPPLRHQRSLTQAAYDGTGRLIATTSLDLTARLWNSESGELLAAPFRHAAHTYSAGLTRTGKKLLVSAATDGRVQVWDLMETDWPVRDLQRYAEALSTQSLSPDGPLTTLSATELAARIAELRAVRPKDFEVTPDQFQRWHRREKLDSLGAGNAFAGEFHARRTALPDVD